MERFITTETLVIELLLIVSLVAIAVRRLRVPYTVALVIVGLLLTTQQPLKLDLTPELILALLVPPLVFEAAFHINLARLAPGSARILLLAVPGVLITTLIVGGLVSLVTPLALPRGDGVRRLISATDPVAVVALFGPWACRNGWRCWSKVKASSTMALPIVVFNLVLVTALTGGFPSCRRGSSTFLRVAVGEFGVGLVFGWLVAELIARIDDYLIETTLTTVLAFGSYLVAERLHVSGVLAVVAAGLINGNIGPRG